MGTTPRTLALQAAAFAAGMLAGVVLGSGRVEVSPAPRDAMAAGEARIGERMQETA